MSVYVTSDLHFGHNKDFLYAARGFKTIEEHDEAIIKNWNSIVTRSDTVIILGDLILNDNYGGIGKLRKLNGHKIILLGNHDTAAREELYENLWDAEVVGYGMPFKYDGYSFYLSHYPTICANRDVDKPLRCRTINLCGHVHTSDRWYNWNEGLIYHCELDAHGNKPVLIDSIIEEINAKLSGE